MELVIVEGKDLEEALSKGLEKLSLTKDDADWSVLAENDEMVKVRIARKGTIEKLLKDIVEEFIEKFGAKGEVEILKREQDEYYINIVTEDSDAVLIGKGGRNLEALQHLISRIVHRYEKTLDIVVDVSGYRKKKEHTLSTRAIAFAEEVKRTGREIFFEPLPPSLRRVIHLALANKEGVRTYTIGEGDLKKVVIAPSRR